MIKIVVLLHDMCVTNFSKFLKAFNADLQHVDIHFEVHDNFALYLIKSEQKNWLWYELVLYQTESIASTLQTPLNVLQQIDLMFSAFSQHIDL